MNAASKRSFSRDGRQFMRPMPFFSIIFLTVGKNVGEKIGRGTKCAVRDTVQVCRFHPNSDWWRQVTFNTSHHLWYNR